MSLRHTILAVLVCAIAPAFAATGADAKARVIMKEKVRYYNVSGSTGREIFKSMLENGPKLGSRNEHALATTEYDYDVQNIDVEIRNGRCIPKKLDLVVTVKYTYPRWRVSKNAGRETRRAWKRFEKSVVWHENQHVKIAKDYANEYAQALKKARLRTRDNCSKASFASLWRASRAALKHNRRQRQFDRRDLRPGGRGYEAQLNLIRAN